MWRFSFWGIKPLQTRAFILREESLRFGHKINVFFFFWLGSAWFSSIKVFLVSFKSSWKFPPHHFSIAFFFFLLQQKRLYLTTYWLLLFVWTCLLEIWRSFPIWWFSSVTFAGKKIKKKIKVWTFPWNSSCSKKLHRYASLSLFDLHLCGFGRSFEYLFSFFSFSFLLFFSTG